MNYLSRDREERRERARRRMLRAREEKLRKIKIYSCMGAIGAIIVVLIAWCVLKGDSSDGDNSIYTKDLMADVNATEDGIRDNGPSINIIEQDTSTGNKKYGYGDNVYSDGKLVVCIDAGHGGADVGCEGADGTNEKDDDLKLAMLLKYQLQSMGVEVVMTRSADVWMDLDDRPYIANQANADILVSIHRNATDDGSANGVEAWVNSTDSDNAYELASIMMSKLELVGISGNRGVKRGTMESKNTDYRVNSLSAMPSVLLEMGFMSSPTDNRLFKDNLTDYAKAIAEAILQWSEAQPY